jgi:Peptidase_C39 like family
MMASPIKTERSVCPREICGVSTQLTLTLKLWKPLVFVIVIVLLGVAVVEVDWNWRRQISPRGGRYFFHRVELAVPSFRQGDEKWNDDPLGGVPENGTIGGEGCAVAAAAMVFKFYGIDVDPQQLNWYLSSVGGYTDRGWLYWDRAAWFAPDAVRHVYEDLPSYALIDSNIKHGNPVIVRVRLRNGITHFVVIAGKAGFDYLVQDPGAGAAKGLYPLRELHSDIEALRFYQPIVTAKPHLAAGQ